MAVERALDARRASARRARAASCGRSPPTRAGSTTSTAPAQLAARRRSARARTRRCPRSARAGQHVGLAEELRHPARARALVDLLGRADLLDAPVAQHGDRVGERERLGLVVRDQQRARAGGAQDRGDLLAQRLAQPGVERGERLVEQHDLGVGGERARQRDALALAAGELVRVGAARGRRGRRARGVSRDPLAARAAPKPTLPRDRQVREQRALLEDHADAALLGLDPGARAGDGAPADLARVPASGRSKPAIMRSSVVLPEPLGPSSATSSPRLDAAGWRPSTAASARRTALAQVASASMARSSASVDVGNPDARSGRR